MPVSLLLLELLLYGIIEHEYIIVDYKRDNIRQTRNNDGDPRPIACGHCRDRFRRHGAGEGALSFVSGSSPDLIIGRLGVVSCPLRSQPRS